VRRLDRLLADEMACGRRAARALIAGGRVFVDGRIVRAGARLVPVGAVVAVAPEADVGTAVSPAPELRILLQRPGLLVLDKPPGVHTHAGAGSASLARAVSERWPEAKTWAASEREAGIVHRLDRDTSGVVLVATDRNAYDALRREFSRRRVLKTYLALVKGRLACERTIDRPLSRSATRVAPANARSRALPAATYVLPLENGGQWSLVEARMRTGVTHQVRAHLASIGHPILGDEKYGGPPAPHATRKGQLLHALAIALDDGDAFAAPAPADFVRALWWLRGGTARA